MLEFTGFVRKPFMVEAVEITFENLEEVAKLIGKVDTDEDGKTIIRVDRKLMPDVYRVSPGPLVVRPGFFMTRMGNHIRCYNRKVFFKQFASETPEIKDWVDFMAKQK